MQSVNTVPHNSVPMVGPFDLQRQMPDATARAMDEYALARANAGLLDSDPCGEAGDRQGGRRLEAEILGFDRELSGREHDVLGTRSRTSGAS